MLLRRLIPRMFHRRLLLLAALAGASLAPAMVQLTRLTVVRHEASVTLAESRLETRAWMPTVRGRILDRHGRVLAEDRPAYRVAVEYTVVTGEWARSRARQLVRQQSRGRWLEMTEADRQRATDLVEPLFVEHLDRAWDLLAQRSGVPRSEIDARREEIVRSVERRREDYARRTRERELAAIERAGLKATPEALRAVERKALAPIREQRVAHAVLPGVPDEVAFLLQRVGEERTTLEVRAGDPAAEVVPVGATIDVEVFPGLYVRDTGEREYPMEAVELSVDRSTFPSPVRVDVPAEVRVEGVAAHVLGWMRDDVFAEDAAARRAFLDRDAQARGQSVVEGVDLGEYREGDRVGHTGAEGALEHEMRGLRGMRTTRLDTGEERVSPARAGRDVRLTIDALLQARVQAVMDPAMGLAVVQPWHGSSPGLPVGTPLNGAAVVLDIDTGEVLAMVSTPGVTRRALREAPETIFDDAENVPYLNRAIAKPYQPGSVVKPLILVEAVRAGNYRLEERIACTGHFFPERPNMFRCWIYKRYQTTHSAQFGHDLSGAESLSASCNIF